MKLLPFDNEKADKEYRNFYNQSGAGSIPIFAGTKSQVGYGLGSMFSNALRMVLPLIKKGAISLGKTALKTGIDVAKDGIRGKNIKKSLSQNARKASTNLLNKTLSNVTDMMLDSKNTRKKSPANKRKRQGSKLSISKNTSKRRRLNTSKSAKDIFSN